MKKATNEYINSMTSSSIEILDDILTNKYKKFKKLYKMISNYSDEIDKINYIITDAKSLDVTLDFNKKAKVKSIKDELKSLMKEKNHEGKIELQDDKTIYISLILEE